MAGGRPRRQEPRYVDADGYVRVRVGDDFIREHRLVAMAMLGRPLAPGERVVHRNGRHDDNSPSNLEIRVTGSNLRGEPAEEVRCLHCGAPWLDAQPTDLAMPIDEVTRRIATGEWSAVEPVPVPGFLHE